MKLLLKKEGITAILVYVFTWFFSFSFVIYQFVSNDDSFSEGVTFFIEFVQKRNPQIGIHLLFLIFYFIFITIRYFFRVYKKRGLKTMVLHFAFRLLLPMLLLSSTYRYIINQNSIEDFDYKWDHSVENNDNHSNDFYMEDQKHRGVHVFGWRNKRDKTIKDLLKSNVEWVAMVPFIYQDDEQTTVMENPEVVGKWRRNDSTFINAIEDVHNKGMHVMFKPHLWLGDGWRSNVNFNTDEDWNTWFKFYRKNMLHYAKLAEASKSELLCIGTELRTSIKQQPEAWLLLIKEIKAIYSGKLTYAANWDDENDLGEFWNALDYIGIQAYFPLTEHKNPALDTIKAGWQKHIKSLERLSEKYNKPILFTEIGYKSEASATIKPWEWDTLYSGLSREKSDETQQLAYQALFESLWHKDWFKGFYIWQWHTHSNQKEKTYKNMDFTPRFKPAENTIAKWFGKSAKEDSSIYDDFKTKHSN